MVGYSCSILPIMPLGLRFGEGAVAVAELRLESLRFKWAGSPDPDSSLGGNWNWKLAT